MFQFPRRWIIAPLAMGLLIAAAGPAWGQALRIDAERLLTDDMVLRASVSDGVWEIVEDPDRQLILLPLRLGTVEEPTELDSSAVSVRGGRFVAWYLPAAGRELEGQAARSWSGGAAPSRPGSVRNGGSLPYQDEQMRMLREMEMEMEMEMGLGRPGGRPQPPSRRGSNRSAPAAGELDAAPPRLTRDVTLLSDGRVRWELTRGIYGGEVAADTSNAYALLLDRDMLTRPEPPGAERRASERRPSLRDPRRRGSSPRDPRGSGRQERPDPAELRRQQEEMRREREEMRRQQEEMQAARAEYSEELRAYRETLQALSDLPEEFTEPAPPVVWAIFSVPIRLSHLTLEGDAPLPWEVSFEQFETLRGLAEGDANAQTLTDALRELLEEAHPFSRRIAAIVLAADSNLQGVPVGGDLGPLLEQLFDKGSTEVRRAIIEAATRDPAQTPIAGRLLDRAMEDPDPSVSLPALRAHIELTAQAGEIDPRQVSRVASTVTALLRSGEDFPTERALGIPLDLAARAPNTLGALAEGINLTEAAPDHRAEAIRFVIDGARRENPLALRWVEDQLLASSDDAVVQQALTLLGEDTEARLPLTSTRHPLFALLGAGNAEMRALAWAALPHFQIEPSGRQAGEYGSSEEEIRGAILGAALASESTPSGAVAFLNEQRDRRFREEALERILMEGRGAGRRDAAFAIAEEDADRLAVLLGAMTGDGRQAVGRVCYQFSTSPHIPATAVVGLLRSQPGGDSVSAADRQQMQFEEQMRMQQEMMRRDQEMMRREYEREQAGPGSGGRRPPAPALQGPDPRGGRPLGDAPGAAVISVVPWFAEQLGEGNLPHPREWAAAAGGEEILLRNITNEDQELGRACAAALLATVVWPEDALVIDLRKAAFEAADEAGGGTEPLARLWRERRGVLAGQALAEAGGRYTVSIQWMRPESAERGGDPLLDPSHGEPTMPVGTYQNRARQMARRQAEYGMRAQQQAEYEAMMREQAQYETMARREREMTEADGDAGAPSFPRGPVAFGEIGLTLSGGQARIEEPNVTVQVVEDPPMLVFPMPSQLQKLRPAEDAGGPEVPWPLSELELRPGHGGGWAGDVDAGNGEGTIHVTFRRPGVN